MSEMIFDWTNFRNNTVEVKRIVYKDDAEFIKNLKTEAELREALAIALAGIRAKEE